MLKVRVEHVYTYTFDDDAETIKIVSEDGSRIVSRKSLDAAIRSGKIEIDCPEIRCLEKRRDSSNRITAYLMEDANGNTQVFEPTELKDLLFKYKVKCSNLTLTADRRIIDSSPNIINKTLMNAKQTDGRYFVAYYKDDNNIGICKYGTNDIIDYTYEDLRVVRYMGNLYRIDGVKEKYGNIEVRVIKYPVQKYFLKSINDNSLTCLGKEDNKTYNVLAEDFFEVAESIHGMKGFLNELRLISNSSDKGFKDTVNIIELLRLYVECKADTNKFVHKLLDLGYKVSMIYPINCYPKIGYYELNDGFLISKREDGRYNIIIEAYRDFKENGVYGDDLDIFSPTRYVTDNFKIIRVSDEQLKLQFNGMKMQFTYRYLTLKFV